ncbi:hypothetical protein KGF56_001905 [Candida oxycetoniae]|uniref:Uncharacterized protein n=1 Tax=Candida oxycetoniae TaxID=497107 RepID=A0AAI9SZ16_9ASCO|nr:uncharacterized protein KGF56_001905 [Candida oxycetoniae]KAI3405293.2 hypothetical protein KGF56_001905 [Candida oxycetoniae]
MADLSMHSEGCNIRHTNVPQQQQQQHTSDESTPSSYNSIDENRNMLKNLAGVIAINAGNVRASGLKMEESISTFGTTKDTLGLVLAWGCTLVYCSSRCPQLYKNYKRKSVEGISPLLFGSALVGNLTYTLSILTSCSFVVGHQRAQLMYQELPYILGSSGTIIFDLVYFYQKRLYKDKRTQTTVMRLQRWSEIEHVNENTGENAHTISTTVSSTSIRYNSFHPQQQQSPLRQPEIEPSEAPDCILEERIRSVNLIDKTDHQIVPTLATATALPHPLSALSRDGILKLSKEELARLSAIPCELSNDEEETISKKFVSIFTDLVESDTRSVSMIYSSLSNSKLKETITKEALEALENNGIASSIIRFILNPVNKYTRDLFVRNLNSIIKTQDMDIEDKRRILSSYLYNISKTAMINSRPIVLNDEIFRQLLEIIGAADLFAYLVHINMRPSTYSLVKELRAKLLHGNAKTKFIAQTGFLKPSQYDLNRSTFTTTHTTRVVEFFTLDEFSNITVSLAHKNEPALTMWSLNCMLTKFPKECEALSVRSNYRLMRRNLFQMLNTVCQVVLRFKNVHSGLQVLKYMKKQNFDIKFGTYRTLLAQLRKSRMFDEFATVFNGMDLKNLSCERKVSIASEIMLLIESKYPTSPKVLIGYVGALYSGKDDKTNSLNILNDLKILSLPYSHVPLNRISSVGMVQLANVDDNLKGLDLDCSCLALVYDVLFRSMGEATDLGSSIIMEYYEIFENYLQNSYIHGFNDRPVTIFFNHLLRKENSTPLSRASSNAYEYAKRIFEFYDKFRVSGELITIDNLELLIRSALLHHDDYEFATRVFEFRKQKNLPSTFRQVFPFVKKHYLDSNYPEAKKWFTYLTNQGIKPSWNEMDDLKQISKDLKLDFNGSKFKSSYSKKRISDRNALQRLRVNSIPFTEDTETL